MSNGASTARLRRDPRRELHAIVRADGRVRIVRGEAAGAQWHTVAPIAQPKELPLRIIEQPAYLVFALPDALDGRLSVQDRDLIGVARALADAEGGAVGVVMFGEPLDDLGLAGADRVVFIAAEVLARYSADARAEALKQLIARERPRHVVLPESEWGGSDLGRRLAAITGMDVATGVWKIDLHHVTRRAAGGRCDLKMPTPPIIVVQNDVGDPVEGTRHEARPLAGLPVEKGSLARCYVALGISGAPQHLQGITACEHVIAVNKDPGCDMMKRATLAIAADTQSVMQALLARLRA